MTEISRQAIVPFSCEQMFALINDVKAYPDFLPWCKASSYEVISDTEAKGGMTISRLGITVDFVTQNTLSPPNQIKTILIEGPFKHLISQWNLTDLGQGCKIEFTIEFEFSNTLTAKTAGPLFAQVANVMLDAFVQRADELYLT